MARAHKKYCLNLILLLTLIVSGVFFPKNASAQSADDTGTCTIVDLASGVRASRSTTRAECAALVVNGITATDFQQDGSTKVETNAGSQGDNPGFWAEILQGFFAWMVTMILKIVSLLTGLSAIILNGVVYYTVVKIAENYSSIPAIDTAWKVIRDLANMGFIFILLYAAINTIIGRGEDAKKLIVRVIIIAVLINFSLFFTKLIIDASNVLALTFYDSIAPNSLNATGGLNLTQAGLSNAFMQHLNLQSLYQVQDSANITNSGIITIGVMGSVMLLIAAFIFFAVAIMLVIRYVVLILVIILSPLAFLSFVLPQLDRYRSQWWNALSGQAFFAPIYFLLTWITLQVLSGVIAATTTTLGSTSGTVSSVVGGLSLGSNGQIASTEQGAVSMLINFVVVIVFLIASLLIAKEWANKAPGGISKLTSWAMGAAGGATLGMAGRFGRGTIGRAGTAIGESERLKEAAVKGGVGGMAARLALATGRKTGGASFDIRGTGLGTTLDAGRAGGKGGFTEFRKQKAESEAKFATSLAPSDKTKAKLGAQRDTANKEIEDQEKILNNPNATPEQKRVAESALEEAKTKKESADKILGNKEEIEGQTKREEENKKKAVDKIRNDEELKVAELAEKSAQDTVNRLEAEAEGAVGSAAQSRIQLAVEAAKENLKKAQGVARDIRRINKETAERVSAEYDQKINRVKAMTTESASERRKAAEADRVQNSIWAKLGGYNYTAAAQIKQGKSKKDKALEAYEEYVKEVKSTEESNPTPPTSPTTPPTAERTPPPTT